MLVIPYAYGLIHMPSSKERLELTIDRNVKREAMKVASQGQLSGLVENYLRFLISPTVRCFKCGKEFTSKQVEACPKCDWMKCKHCHVCGCWMNTETAAAMRHMRWVFEELIGGRRVTS
jgi:predicted Zn-ribbon and HTH transcriptional regulator